VLSLSKRAKRCRFGTKTPPRSSSFGRASCSASWSEWRVYPSTSKLKSTPPKEPRQLDINLRHALAADGMARGHVAAKRVWGHKGQLQTHRRRSRIKHLKQSTIFDPFPAAREERLNLLKRLMYDPHKNEPSSIVAERRGERRADSERKQRIQCSKNRACRKPERGAAVRWTALLGDFICVLHNCSQR